MVDINKLVKRLEEEFTQEKKEETQEIHNRIVEACKEGNINNILTALKLVEHAILLKKLKEIYPELFEIQKK